MADATQATTLLPVIVGGVIAIAGGLVGPPVLFLLQRSAEKKKHRAEKFEELVATLYEFDHWLIRQRNILVYGEKDDHTLTPFGKIQAIATAYFSEFNKQLGELYRLSKHHEVWMGEAGQRRLKGDIASLGNGMTESYAPYWQKFVELLSALQQYAQKNLN